jgi:diguanylate cyclase (GGDEF)-like protein
LREAVALWLIYDCLVVEHEFRLVLLAALICLCGSAATFVIAERALAGGARASWLLLVAVCGGGTVWSTHFVAMLAYQQQVPTSYEVTATLGSLVVGVLAIGGGFALALRHPGRRGVVVVGGFLAGGGAVALHHIGMLAIRLPGRLDFSGSHILASVGLGLIFGMLAFLSAFGSVGKQPGRRVLGIAAFIAMTVSLHFSSMLGVTIELGLWQDSAVPALSRNGMAMLVTVSTAAVIAIGLAGALFDQRSARKLLAQAERFRVLSDSAMEGLVIHRDGLLVDSNAAAQRMLALGSAGRGIPVHRWFKGLEPGKLGRQLAQAEGQPVEVELQGTDGRCFTAEICTQPLELEDGGQGQILAIRDITARKAAEARLHHQARHDQLTDLPNRRLFLELASKLRAHAERQKEPFAVMMLDLDGFKSVNDMHGHENGDRLLVEVTRRIKPILREDDILARFGGDEFALIGAAAGRPHEAATLAERLLGVIAAPIRLSDAEVTIGVSIGIAFYPHDGGEISDLLRNADTAMYRAKADGKATFRFFEAQMNVALERRRMLETSLRRAISEGRIEVAYQPLVDSRSKVPIGFEALGRWHDPVLGQVAPADFIPVAEETGLIVPLVLRAACEAAAKWPAALRIAVNLSAVQFKRPGLVEMIKRILEETGLPGDRLDLEITESILIENREQVLQILRDIKALGIGISMDDFGTGYSSLSYLQSFPFDKLKIDRSFINQLGGTEHGNSIVKAIAAMGRSLQMKVAAEGVETDAQALYLRDLACDELQGFLFAEPMTRTAADSYVEQLTRVPMAS